ncbi:VWA domain-containing protein [Asanoa sp. NPDC049573]|uniref:vWA domain-containing protein n=1 Tax=Asanoa sp. NPDC049573 TaxID=3155396 RepID=UPI003444F05B
MSQQILPFYLVCDESASMAGESIDSVNTSLPDIHHQIASQPAIADKARLCLIGFADDAEVLLPLSDLGAVSSIPALKAHGGTSYGAAFTRLRETIAADVDRLKTEGHRVYRPAVFFLSDGLPTDDDWEQAYRDLTDESWKPHPNILAFGFGWADRHIIRQVATMSAYMANGELGPAQALAEFAKSLIHSMLLSATRPADSEAGPALSKPDTVQGFTRLEPEEV